MPKPSMAHNRTSNVDEDLFQVVIHFRTDGSLLRLKSNVLYSIGLLGSQHAIGKRF